MKPTLIGFDVDGTLVDSLMQSYKVDCELIKRAGGKVPSLKEYRAAIGNIDLGTSEWADFYKLFQVEDRIDVEEYYKLMEQAHIQALPDTREGLKYLSTRWKIPFFVVSINSSKRNVVKRLQACDLEDFFQFDSIYAEPETKTMAMVRECAKRDIAPDDTFFVGDTVKDIIESRRAGVHPIAMVGPLIKDNTSYNTSEMLRSKVDEYISRIAELERLVWRD